MDAKKMQAMIDVFSNAPQLAAGIDPPRVKDDTVVVIIDGWYSKSYLYTKLNEVFNNEDQQPDRPGDCGPADI